MTKEKWCHYCSRLFIPDRRVGNRQKACSRKCQRIRKEENNRMFSKNNPDYWQGRYEYVKEWRQRNPDYQKQWKGKKKIEKKDSTGEIQAEIMRKALENIDKNLLSLREIQAEIILKDADIKGNIASFTFQVQ